MTKIQQNLIRCQIKQTKAYEEFTVGITFVAAMLSALAVFVVVM